MSTTQPAARLAAVLFLLAVTCLVVPIGSALASLLAIFIVSAVVIWAFNDRTFSDPIAIFTLFFLPYSTWYAINRIGAPGGWLEVVGLTEALNLSLVGLASFVLAGFLMRFILPISRNSKLPEPQRPRYFSKGLLLVCCVIIWTALAEVMTSGLSTKREIIDADMTITAVAGLVSFALAVGVVWFGWGAYIRRGMKGVLSNPYILLGGGTLAAMMFVMGERDAVFRVGFAALVILGLVSRRARTWKIMLLLAGIIVVFPVTQSAKGILIGGAPIPLNAETIFGGEFISALRNTQRLVEHGVDHSMVFIWNDLVRALSPLVRGEGITSTTAWYHDVYRVENGFAGTAGWGFGYVAQGYLVGGWVGVAILMASVSAILHVLRHQMIKSDLWAIFYAFALATAIYCIRADLANFLSQTFKVGGAAVLLFALARVSDRILVASIRPTVVQSSAD